MALKDLISRVHTSTLHILYPDFMKRQSRFAKHHRGEIEGYREIMRRTTQKTEPFFKEEIGRYLRNFPDQTKELNHVISREEREELERAYQELRREYAVWGVS